ncbi:HNH endonuclease signature motif containing protein, partial [Burkholderia multivorans]|uniref:HNH endonuclease signature motif containing protein n=1 Tax=Burkholderia multivorans TaxID=87883 RepID=UPI0028705C71
LTDRHKTIPYFKRVLVSSDTWGRSRWHVHHIVRRVDGGSNQRGNLVMVHPNCHNQIHSLGLEVAKPVPAMGL